MKTQSLLAVVIVLLASTLCAAQSPYPEPCTFKTGTIYPWDWAVECFQSIPLQQGIKEQTIDALTKVVELYAFLDIANSSPDPTHLPMKVDLIKELLEINSRPYKFDYDFHDDLRALFLQLNDAHTQYYAPTCYQNIVLRQAFYPVQYVNSTQQQVIAVSPYFDSDVVAHFKSQGLDLTQYVGAQILSVNGVDGLSYFKEFANNSVGVSKDFGTRLNIAMAVAQPQPAPLNRFVEASYWQTRTKRNPFPRTPILYFDLKLTNGTKTTVEIPWVVTSKTNYNGIQSFLKDYYATPTSFDSKTPVEVVKKAFPQPPPLIEKRRASFVAPSHVDSSAASTDFTLLVNSTNLQFWMLNDSRTLVMYLDTMAPAHYGETFKALNDGFAAAAKKGLNRIIIDLTNNGGGNICFGASLLAYFQNHTGQNWGPQDLPLGLLQKDLTTSAVNLNVANTVWSPGFYDSQQGVHIANNDTSYIMPGVPHVRGGRLRNYSKLLHIDNCGNFGYRIDPPIYFKPSETIILTQGFCGSTCAMFANHMALYDNVITVVVGGFPNRPMQYSSFPGLQVLDSPDIYSQFIQLGKNVTAAYTPKDVIPRELPTTATYRMCIREIYPPTKAYNTQPMEYTFQQANHHLNYTSQTAVQPEYIWYQATPFFSN